YLEHAATVAGVACALRESRKADGTSYSVEEFVDTLLKKSEGVWVYLQYVLEGIEQEHSPARRGEHPPLNLDELPVGLWRYYALFFLQWKEQNLAEWHGVHLPLLAALAAAQETLTVATLSGFAGLERELAELP